MHPVLQSFVYQPTEFNKNCMYPYHNPKTSGPVEAPGCRTP